MTRDQFIHHMDTVQAYLDQCNALSKALQQHLANDSMATHITLGADMLSAYLDLIEEAVGDGPFAPRESYSSWVRWYLWEAKFPHRLCTVGDSSYLVQDPGTLYDVITEWKKLP